MPTRWMVRVSPGAIVLSVCTGCALQQPRVGIERTRIRDLLDQQAKDWNSGDLDAFVGLYWDSPRMTYCSGGNVVRGRAQLFEDLARRYPSPEVMGHLKFDRVEIDLLTEELAVAHGRWHLRRDEPISGSFSLVLRKHLGQWAIIHDHTCRDEP